MTKLLHGNEKSSLTGGREPLFSQKELLVLAIPLLVEQLLEVTVGMADTMMVSRCGEAAISGVSLVDMINSTLIPATTSRMVLIPKSSPNLAIRRSGLMSLDPPVLSL